MITAIILGGGDKTGDLGHAVLIETDFGASSEPIVDAISRKLSPTFSGVVAEGWAENSSNWADVRANCRVMQEEGRGFLRVDVSEQETGWANPALWDDRCDECRKNYGDDHAKADATVFGIYYRAIKERIPDAKFVAVVYPYTGRYLDPAELRKEIDDLAARMDELRISSVRRYSEPFVPAKRLDADSATLALFHFDGDLGAEIPAGCQAAAGPVQ